MGTSKTITGIAAGVPFVALSPEDAAGPAPLIITWHQMEAPSSEAAMAAAIPMAGVPAWRVHFGLPMSGGRAPAGGREEFFRLASEDYILNVAEPMTDLAASEFPAAVADLRSRMSLSDGPIGIVGGSAGGAVALEVLTRAELEISAAALVNPVTQLAPAIARNERAYGATYPWTDRSRAVAERFDFVRRAGEITADVLLVCGEDDDIAFREPAAMLHELLGDRAELVTIPGMGHSFADAPGIEAAPQNADALRVDAVLTEWFLKHL
jgi:pimeloyl-ACP methyl ester carboxylesterase